MNVLAACGGDDSPVRKVVFKSSAHYYGCRAGRPGLLHRDDGPPAPAAHADRARHRRGRGAVREFARAPPRTSRSPCCASPTCSAPTLRTSQSQLFALPAVPGDPRLRPALSVRPRGRRRRRASSTRCATTCRASTTAPPTACSRSARSPACWASRCARAAAAGAPALAAGALRRARRAHPAGDARAAALRPRPGQPQLKATGYRYRYTTREAVLKLGEHQRLRRIVGGPGALPLRARGRGVPALQPERAPDRAPAGRPPRRNLAPGERRGANPAPGAGGLRRPRRRRAHRSAALAGARGAGRRSRPTNARTPRARGPEGDRALAAAGKRAPECLHFPVASVRTNELHPGRRLSGGARRLGGRRCTPTTTRARTRSRRASRSAGVAVGGLSPDAARAKPRAADPASRSSGRSSSITPARRWTLGAARGARRAPTSARWSTRRSARSRDGRRLLAHLALR